MYLYKTLTIHQLHYESNKIEGEPIDANYTIPDSRLLLSSF